MVQGVKISKTNINHKQGSKKKEKVEAPKQKLQKCENSDQKERLKEDELYKNIQKKVKEHKKKIYRSIEQTIIDKAKKSKERFTII